MRKTTFVVYTMHRHPNGRSVRLHEVFGLTPAEQREKLNVAILGYDVHHPDTPEGDLKFRAR